MQEIDDDISLDSRGQPIPDDEFHGLQWVEVIIARDLQITVGGNLDMYFTRDEFASHLIYTLNSPDRMLGDHSVLSWLGINPIVRSGSGALGPVPPSEIPFIAESFKEGLQDLSGTMRTGLTACSTEIAALRTAVEGLAAASAPPPAPTPVKVKPSLETSTPSAAPTSHAPQPSAQAPQPKFVEAPAPASRVHLPLPPMYRPGLASSRAPATPEVDAPRTTVPRLAHEVVSHLSSAIQTERCGWDVHAPYSVHHREGLLVAPARRTGDLRGARPRRSSA